MLSKITIPPYTRFCYFLLQSNILHNWPDYIMHFLLLVYMLQEGKGCSLFLNNYFLSSEQSAGYSVGICWMNSE